MRELFVYYRIRADAASAGRAAVLSMQHELRTAHPGLSARLLTRRDESGAATWMETYARPPSGIDATLQDDIDLRATRLPSFIEGSRHVEAFENDGGC
jgi:hypothetical protein